MWAVATIPTNPFMLSFIYFLLTVFSFLTKFIPPVARPSSWWRVRCYGAGEELGAGSWTLSSSEVAQVSYSPSLLMLCRLNGFTSPQ